MEKFDNVSVVKAANVYFGGGVTSRTVLFADGTKKTLGIMQPGEYSFDTGVREVMEILSGRLEVQLPDSDAWISLSGGQSFAVPANATFTVRVQKLTDYVCSFGA
jgi:uncharacterized protein YaiE (UPF0345 family)